MATTTTGRGRPSGGAVRPETRFPLPAAARRDWMLGRMFARDRACDGQFVTGVKTTGIYCLPSCSARKPKAGNVRFFPDEATARGAGLRPCRRCRPDHFYRDHDPDLERVVDLVGSLRREPSGYSDVASLARAAGIGVTKLTRLFRLHYHATPAAALQQARVAAAQRLLLHTDRRPVDIGLDAGFESSSVFYDCFHRLSGLAPLGYRRLRRDREFVLDLPGDFRIGETLRYQGRDPESPTERVHRNRLWRAVRLDSGPAVLSIALQGGRALCRVESPRPVDPDGMARVHRIIRRMLGLGTDPATFEHRVRRLRPLGRLVGRRAGLRIPQTATLYEGLVWAIIGQQINLPFALRLRRRLIALAGRRTGHGLMAHPRPEEVARLDPRDLLREQFSERKTEYLIGISRLIVSGGLDPRGIPQAPATVVERRLLAVRGLGPWSVHYVMMRACGFADCLPVGDSGLTAALERVHRLRRRPDPAQTRVLMQPYAPHRSLATFHLWHILGDPA